MDAGNETYKVTIGIGTGMTRDDVMLTRVAPGDFAKRPLTELADLVLQQKGLKGAQGELARNVQRIMSAKTVPLGRPKFVMEINGRPVDPRKPAAQYLDQLRPVATEGKEDVRLLYMKVTSRDGGGYSF